MGGLKNLAYSLLAALLLSLPWLFELPGYLLFIGFIPLFLLENKLSANFGKNTRFVYLNNIVVAFFLWNLLSAWWLGYATIVGLVLFLFLNTFLMSTIWYLYHLLKLRTNENLALVFLVSLWISFEFLHLNWDMQLPGLTLGGAFGNHVKLVQWFEFTGVLGGSLWILLVNISVYKMVKLVQSTRKISYRLIINFVAILVIPIVISQYIYFSYTEKGDIINIQVLQPNIDPFTEKFDKTREEQQLDILFSLINSSENKSLIIGPETALPSFWEDSTEFVSAIKKMKKCIINNPGKTLIMGANTKKLLTEKEKSTATTRFLDDGKTRYEEYNSAVLLDSSDRIQVYHKNILVSGVEKVPFVKYFTFLKNFFFDLGGTTGGLKSGVPMNLSIGNSLKISPLICFESMFGEYLGNLVTSGGELIVVMTNDGWWKRSSGAGLHFSYSRLRAIETRRSIARSANTGFSGFISQRGDVIKKTEWWTQTAISADLRYNQTTTFYTRNGDYLGRIASFVSALLFLLLISGRVKEKHLNGE